VEEAVTHLNGFLEGITFVAGNNVTLADFAILATVSTIDVYGFDLTPYPNVARWLTFMKSTTPGWEANKVGLDLIAQKLKQ